MNRSSRNSALLAIACILLAHSTLAGTALNQPSPPKKPALVVPPPMMPPPAIRVEEASPPMTPESPAAPVMPTAPIIAGQPAIVPADPKITVSPTSALSAEGTGTLRTGNGGLPATLWQGNSRKQIEQWLPPLSRGYLHESVRGLVSRLMRSEAELPDEKSNSHYLSQRVRGLFQMGDLKGAAELAATVPASMKDEELEMLRKDIALFSGKPASACADIEEIITQYDSLYWQKLLVFCQAVTGKPDAAEISLSVLEEKAVKLPAYFPQMIRRFQDKSVEVGELPEALPTADAAMLIASGYTSFSNEYLAKAPLPVLAAAARPDSALENLRAMALEKSALYGALPLEEVQKFYESLTPSGTGGFDPGKPYEGVRGRAQLWQLQKAETLPEKRVQVLARAMTAFDKAGLRPLALRLFLDAYDGITNGNVSVDAIKPILPDVIDALALDKRMDKAHRLAPKSNDFDAFMAQSLLAIAPGGQSTGLEIGGVSVPDTVGDNAVRRLYRSLAVLDALAMEVPEVDMSDRPLTTPVAITQVASPALLKQMSQAAEKERIGEVVALSGILLGGDSLARVSDETLVAVLKALQMVGLEEDARAIARDAIIALGR